MRTIRLKTVHDDDTFNLHNARDSDILKRYSSTLTFVN